MPKFTHDCDKCQFIGQNETHDFYFCPNCELPQGTLIARYGNEGWEYASTAIAILKHHIDDLRRQRPEYPLVTAWDIYHSNHKD